MELCSGWMEFPKEVLGMASPSHRGSSGGGGKRTPASLVQLGGRMETGDQVIDFLFQNILVKAC